MSTLSKPRLVVLTDIGGDPDDEQSLIRLLCYANEFDIEGIIPQHWATESHARRGRTPERQMELVCTLLAAYGKVRESLARHAEGYPTAEELLRVLKRGAEDVPGPVGDRDRGAALVGAGRDTEGSDWLIEVVDRDDPRPVDIVVWGGPADLAQALWRVQNDRTPEELTRFVAKLRVHTIDYQDDSGLWIEESFPGLFLILDLGRDGDKWKSCYRGMFLTGDLSTTSREWVMEHIARGHGPLGELYPLETYTGPNPHRCLKEGDTPSWFFFLPNGLNVPERPDWGGWGGRFTQERSRYFRDAADTLGGECGGPVTISRWRPAFQNEFAARMDWCVKPYHEANHPPVAVVNGDATRRPITLRALPGQRLLLDASDSYDPDANNLRFSWWVYREAGTYAGAVSISEPHSSRITVTVPGDIDRTEFHVILEVIDDGDPPLTAYRRIVVQGAP